VQHAGPYVVPASIAMEGLILLTPSVTGIVKATHPKLEMLFFWLHGSMEYFSIIGKFSTYQPSSRHLGTEGTLPCASFYYCRRILSGVDMEIRGYINQ
jgi:hypothetical protein